jgi:hypothetical protein
LLGQGRNGDEVVEGLGVRVVVTGVLVVGVVLMVVDESAAEAVNVSTPSFGTKLIPKLIRRTKAMPWRDPSNRCLWLSNMRKVRMDKNEK